MQVSGQSPNELGRLLAGAQGYKVFTHEGVALGALERIRYETQVSRPDDIVVCGRGLLRRNRCTFPFELIYAVSAQEGKVVLRPTSLEVHAAVAHATHAEA